MAIILNIDTAVGPASVCLSSEAQPVQFAISENQKDHASWLHPAIKRILADAKMDTRQLEAIAVTIGPGSYTGLRIGLATAKGLCFALQIPLIGINTLEMMANAVKEEEADLFCPVIDARRMEVFMACYNKKMEVIAEPCAMIVSPNSFDSLLQSGKTVFTGNGSEKIRQTIDHPNAVYRNTKISAMDMISLSAKSYADKRFADIAYSEPFYIKEFYSAAG